MMYRQTYRQNVNNNKNKKIICIPCSALFFEFKKKTKKLFKQVLQKYSPHLKLVFIKTTEG